MKSLTRPLRVMHIISGDLWAGAEVQAYTLLKQLQQHVQLKVILLNEGELAIKLRQLGIELIILPEANMNSLRLFFGVFWQIFKFNPNILHTHRQKENILGGIANFLSGLFGRGGKSLRTAHGAPEFRPLGLQRLQMLLDLAVGRCLQRAVIAVSKELKIKLRGFYSEKKIHIIQNGVDIEALRNTVLPINFVGDVNTKHLGIIGRLEPVKRIDLFLRTAAELQGTSCGGENWHFHVIGDGGRKGELVDLAQQLGLSRVVTFHGHRHDVANCIAGLDAVVMCSDHEGMPMVALETLALGVPLIAHNVGGLRELLAGFPDLAVDDHRAEAYASCLQRVCKQKPALNVHLDEDYSAQDNCRKTLELYRRLFTV